MHIYIICICICIYICIYIYVYNAYMYIMYIFIFICTHTAQTPENWQPQRPQLSKSSRYQMCLLSVHSVRVRNILSQHPQLIMLIDKDIGSWGKSWYRREAINHLQNNFSRIRLFVLTSFPMTSSPPNCSTLPPGWSNETRETRAHLHIALLQSGRIPQNQGVPRSFY